MRSSIKTLVLVAGLLRTLTLISQVDITDLKRYGHEIASIAPADTSFNDLTPLAEAIGASRIVLLGEQAHGEGSTFSAKIRLVKFLHQKLGFNTLIFEAGMYDAMQSWKTARVMLNMGKHFDRIVYSQWSLSEELTPLKDYLDDQLISDMPLEFAGMDVHFVDSTQFIGYKLSTQLEQFLDNRGIQVTNWPIFKKVLARSLSDMRRNKSTKSEVNIFFEVLEELKESIDHMNPGLASDLEWSIGFWKRMLASIEVTMRVKYDRNYLKIYEKSRDREMGKNLIWLLHNVYPDEKVIVWAASFHNMKNMHLIEKQSGIDYSDYTTMGHYLYQEFKEEVYSLAFTGYEGQLFDLRTHTILEYQPASPGSFEHFINIVGKEYFFFDFKEFRNELNWLSKPMVARLLGNLEMNAIWAKNFDGVFYIKTVEPSSRIKK